MMEPKGVYLTELQAIDGCIYEGLRINAESFEQAEKIVEEKYGYLTVIGEARFTIYNFELN